MPVPGPMNSMISKGIVEMTEVLVERGEVGDEVGIRAAARWPRQLAPRARPGRSAARIRRRQQVPQRVRDLVGDPHTAPFRRGARPTAGRAGLSSGSQPNSDETGGGCARTIGHLEDAHTREERGSG